MKILLAIPGLIVMGLGVVLTAIGAVVTVAGAWLTGDMKRWTEYDDTWGQE
jgi:2-methylcitrate dehydratase PrpD